VLYNNAGTVAGSSNLTFNGTAVTANQVKGTFVPRTVTFTVGSGPTTVTIADVNAVEMVLIVGTTSGAITIANPTANTPQDGQKLMIRIVTASSYTLSFGTSFSFSTDLPLPSPTSGGGLYDYLGFVWNSAANSGVGRWQVIAKMFGVAAS
jgi:hypothetical protein